jgi:hypothetical protein
VVPILFPEIFALSPFIRFVHFLFFIFYFEGFPNPILLPVKINLINVGGDGAGGAPQQVVGLGQLWQLGPRPPKSGGPFHSPQSTVILRLAGSWNMGPITS